MTKINLEYFVVASASSFELATVVNQYLDKGWSLQGGLTACHVENDEYNCVFAQAITRPRPADTVTLTKVGATS